VPLDVLDNPLRFVPEEDVIQVPIARTGRTKFDALQTMRFTLVTLADVSVSAGLGSYRTTMAAEIERICTTEARQDE
jgi:hypothetical protein